MAFCDEPVPVEIGEDGLSQFDWDLMHSAVNTSVAGAKAHMEKHPSISSRQYYANVEAARLRIWAVWRKKMGYV